MNNDIYDFAREIEQVKSCFSKAIVTSNDLIREVAEYMNLGTGKMLRPRLVLSVAHSLKGIDESVLQVAAAVEMIHVAALLHDDVIDKASTRRGIMTVNVKYGDDVAILMADWLFSQAFELGLYDEKPQILSILSKATRKMCESEMFQIQKRGMMLTPEDYYWIIEAKTASLFSASAEIGAVLGEANAERRDSFAQYGQHLGMAFQIVDDVLDYTATDGRWGKNVGNDLARGKQTLPLIRTFEMATEIEREALSHQLNNGREMGKVFPIIEKYRGIEYSHDKAFEYLEQADGLIPRFNVNSASEMFKSINRFVAERSH